MTESTIDCTPVIKDSSVKTPRAYIWIDTNDGSRTVALDITGYIWINPGQIKDDLFRRCSVILVDGRAKEATLAALNIARSAKVITVFDCGANRQGLLKMLPMVDFFLASVDLADTFYVENGILERTSTDNKEKGGEIPRADSLAKCLITLGVNIAVVTIGKRGAVWADRSGGGITPSIEVKVIDSTGAGDVFHGGFIHGILKNWGLTKSIYFANVAAALSCRKVSGIGGIPEISEVEKYLSKHA